MNDEDPLIASWNTPWGRTDEEGFSEGDLVEVGDPHNPLTYVVVGRWYSGTGGGLRIELMPLTTTSIFLEPEHLRKVPWSKYSR